MSENLSFVLSRDDILWNNINIIVGIVALVATLAIVTFILSGNKILKSLIIAPAIVLLTCVVVTGVVGWSTITSDDSANQCYTDVSGTVKPLKDYAISLVNNNQSRARAKVSCRESSPKHMTITTIRNDETDSILVELTANE